MSYEFKPTPLVRARIVVLAILIAPLFFSSHHLIVKGATAAVLTALVGTYRRSYIDDARLHRGFVIAFVQQKPKRWGLQRFTQIEIDIEEGAGWMELVLFGPLWPLFWVVDWLFPWFGGRYQLWLRSAKGKRVLVWQGNGEHAFQENTRYLESVTGLEVVRATT